MEKQNLLMEDIHLKEDLKIIKLMEKEYLNGEMEMFMKEK